MSELRIYLRGRKSDGSRSDELKDITAVCGGVTLEGSVSGASRKLTLNVLRYKADYYLGDRASIKRGDGIVLDDGSASYIFYGVVWRVEVDDSSAIMTVTCWDNMKFLMVSDVITNIWTDVTPLDVTRDVCKELGVTCGDLPECCEKISVNARGKTGYEAMMIAWTEAHKLNGKVYYPRMDGYKLRVIEKGEKLEGHALKHYSQDAKGSIIKVELTEDSEEAVTAIYTRNTAGTPTFQEADKELVKLIGYIVGVNDESQSTKQSEVKAISEGEKTATVEAIGDWAMQTGWSVPIESDILTEELLYIESDTHYYENGIHTMTLELSYTNEMDEVEQDEIEAESGTVEGNTTEEKIWNYLRSDGYSAAATAAIMGNMYAESGCQPDVTEAGGGGGYGLVQWTGSRRTDLVNWCANNGYSYSSLEGQLNFLSYEMEGGNSAWTVYAAAHCGGNDGFKELTDVSAAVQYFLAGFEVAGVAALQKRMTAANDYYERWKNYKTIPASSTEGDGAATGSMLFPLPSAVVGSTYNNHTYQARDYAVPTGTAVRACDGGTVTWVQYWDGRYYGQYGASEMATYGTACLINHGNGYTTRYAHLSQLNVQNGQKVSRGQQIGLSGSTGNSTGPHLHLEVVYNGTGIDPSTINWSYS